MISMPILVQWKWIERTETFLVIFHSDGHYSGTNLRSTKITFEGKKPIPQHTQKKEGMLRGISPLASL